MDLQWGPCRSQTEEKDRSIRPELEDKNINIDKYDTIFIGFPIWWYSLSPSIILTFLESYNFKGKKIIIWDTTWKTSMGDIMIEIKNIIKGANTIEVVIFDQNHRNIENYKNLFQKYYNLNNLI